MKKLLYVKADGQRHHFEADRWERGTGSIIVLLKKREDSRPDDTVAFINLEPGSYLMLEKTNSDGSSNL